MRDLDDLDDGNFEGCSDCYDKGIPEVVPPGAFVYSTPMSRENVASVEEILDDGIERYGEGTRIYIGTLKDGRWFAVFSGHDYSGHG